MFLKRTLPIVACFVIGVIFTLQFFVPNKASEKLLEDANIWVTIIGFAASILGIVMVASQHAGRIAKLSPGWGYSFFMFIGFFLACGIGLATKGENFTEQNTTTAWLWFYNYIFSPLSATVFSILGFFVASAAFRAFRVRTLTAALLCITAMIVMFCMVPLGEYFLGFLGIRDTVSALQIKDWIIQNPGMAARRAILLGVTLGAIATSLRIIFGIERVYLGKD